ncbi:DUF2020 domain-containing protein [Corynebacterium sp. H130]|uniref:DUF2020 domain-containing protein n=1 Tax=Corynebacterium sp. H130 TaxID=3133444 RepID=UPI00309F17CB
MRSLLPIAVLALTLTACTTGSTPTEPSTNASAPTTFAAGDQGLPFDALPEIPAGRNDLVPCPYLDTQWVADTNGQRVLGSGIDPRFDHPACVFWSYTEEPQLTVIVRTMGSEAEAEQVVNWAAPIDSTDPADDPEGWMGGRQGTPGRSLYSVYKNNIAVTVFTNQDQSLKAELVAKETIKNLGL